MGIFNKIPTVDLTDVLLKQAAGIDYDKILSSLNGIPQPFSVPSSLRHGIGVLKNAAEVYNNSGSDNKTKEYTDCLVKNIDAQLILTDIKPLVNKLPYGKIIVLLLEFILKKQKN
jgi:hypothetical protein